jgi:hypothetical protein
LAKIAVALNRALAQRDVDGTPGAAIPRIIARGDGWTVADVICTSGPRDRSFEEQHACVAIASWSGEPSNIVRRSVAA